MTAPECAHGLEQRGTPSAARHSRRPPPASPDITAVPPPPKSKHRTSPVHVMGADCSADCSFLKHQSFTINQSYSSHIKLLSQEENNNLADSCKRCALGRVAKMCTPFNSELSSASLAVSNSLEWGWQNRMQLGLPAAKHTHLQGF